MTIERIDKYEILEKIGDGGMGTIYKALHPQFKKYMAIKEVCHDLASVASVQRQFEREVELLAKLPLHPNIVTVRDAMVWHDRLYLVMDYIEGGTLADLIAQGRVDHKRGAYLLDQILSALVVVHQQGIVHRDIKPSNILIDLEGAPHISDFGIATLMGADTQAQAMATVKYAAPESIDRSLNPGGTEQQIDLYSTGMLAYEAFLGKNRFREAFHEVYNGRPEVEPRQWLLWQTDLTRSVRDLNEIDPAIPGLLANIIERLMAKDVNERYRSASEARRDLTAWLGQINDARGRRTKPPSDDVTLPIDQIRGSAPHPARTPSSRRATRPDLPMHREPAALRESYTEAPDISDQPPPKQSRGIERPLPRWAWWVAAVAALVIVAAVVLFSFLLGSPGFILIVQGAPPGSDVYVDGVRRGVPSSNGDIRVMILEAGRSRDVRVSCEGYEDAKQSVVGEDGKEKLISVSLKSGGRQSEIDYNGPMILIPAGEFIMGDNEHESDEKPAHPVKLPDYYIDKFEVTNAQYKKFCDETRRPYPTNAPWHKEYFTNNPDSPVMGVSWDDAAEYAKWAAKRLPTEPEWEKAASWDPTAQKKRRWPWGDKEESGRANLGVTPYPSRVGSYPQGVSAYGVHDLAGNAAEWVDSYYQAYQGNPDPPSPDFGTANRIARGGSFKSPFDEARTTFREPKPSGYKAGGYETTQSVTQLKEKITNTSFGFRCAISADDSRLQEYLRKTRTK